MSSLITRKQFTVEEYFQMAETGILAREDRVELIRGEILTMSPIGPSHNAAVARSTHGLVSAVGGKSIVWIQNSAQLSEFTAPQPDIVLLRPRADFYASKLPEPGDILLIVEVAESSLEYDRDIKSQLYAEAGVPEYWIADIRDDSLLVFQDLREGRYRVQRRLRRGERIAPRLLPDCEIVVDTMLP